MEKPIWRRRASSYVVNSPYMRLRADDVELPNGTIVRDYYVRESRGFVTVFPLTGDDRVVLVRQYRYGTDAIHLELPAGMLLDDEDPQACALRELAEETGYQAERCEFVGDYFPEPVRSAARAYLYVAYDARLAGAPQPDATEHLEVEVASLARFREMLRDGTIDAGGSVAGGYRALEHLGRL